jgi:hypothetical protein
MEKQEKRRGGGWVIPWFAVTLILVFKAGNYLTVAMHRSCPCSTTGRGPFLPDLPWPFDALLLLAQVTMGLVLWWVSQALWWVLKKTVVRWIRRPPKET